MASKTRVYNIVIRASNEKVLKQINVDLDAQIDTYQQLADQIKVYEDALRNIEDKGSDAFKVISVELEKLKGISGDGLLLLNQNAQSVGELKTQIKFLEQALANEQIGSETFKALSEQLKKAKTQLGDINTTVTEVSKRDKFEGFIKIGNAIAGGFVVAKSTIAAFSEELGLSEQQVEKLTQKLQIYRTALEGLNLIQEAMGKENKLLNLLFAKQTIATNTQTAATNRATAAQIRLNLAMLANPIVLITTAILALVAGLYAYSKASEDTKKKIREWGLVIFGLFQPLLLIFKAIKDLVGQFDFLQKGLDNLTSYLGQTFSKFKDYIAQTTGLFATEFEKQRKIREEQLIQDTLIYEKLKQAAQKSFEETTEIYRRQTKLRSNLTVEQLQAERKIIQLELERFERQQKKRAEELSTLAKINTAIKENANIDLGLAEETNEVILKRLELQNKEKEINLRIAEQILADEVEAGERRVTILKLTNASELDLAKLRKKNLEEQLRVATEQFGANSKQVLAIKEKIFDATNEIKRLKIEAIKEENEEILANARIQGKTENDLAFLRKNNLEKQLKLVRELYGTESREALKVRDELEAINRELNQKIKDNQTESARIGLKIAGGTEIELLKLRKEQLEERLQETKRAYGKESLEAKKLMEEIYDITVEIDAKIAAEKDKKDKEDKDRLKKNVELFKEIQESLLAFITAINDAIIADIDRRIADARERIRLLEDEFNASLQRAEDLRSALDEARGKRREDIIKQLEAERKKQKQLSDEKLKQERLIQTEELKKQKLITTTNALNQTATAINIIQANSEALKAVAKQGFFATFPANLVAIGTTLAAIVSAFAAIKAMKFAKGGYTGDGFGNADETGYKPAGIVHENEYVVPERVLSTQKGSSLVRELEFMRRGFAGGGFTSDITPNFLDINSTLDKSNAIMIQKLDEIKASNAALANRKYVVSVEAFEKVKSEITNIQTEATI